MNKTSVTLIGGRGFLGTRLAEVLTASTNWEPVILDHVTGSIHCDVTDGQQLISKLPPSDWVVNLAAVHHDNVRPISRYYEVNVGGAENVCNACRQLEIRKQVFISSVAVYGDTSGRPCTENTVHRPFNDYGRSKSQAEDVYRAWHAEDPTRHLIIVRPTVIFGERNRGNLYNLMHSIAQSKFRMVGSGNVVKSIAYVENVACFIPFLMQQCEPGLHVLNYADKPDPTTSEIVAVIREELGMAHHPLPHVPFWIAFLGGMAFDVIGRLTPFKSPISAQRVKKFCTATPVDSSCAADLGYEAPVPVMEALRQTVRAEFPR